MWKKGDSLSECYLNEYNRIDYVLAENESFPHFNTVREVKLSALFYASVQPFLNLSER